MGVTLYLRPRRAVRAAPGQLLTLGDLAELAAADGHLVTQLRSIPVGRAPEAGRFAVVPILGLLRQAEEAAQPVPVRLVGGDDVVVESVASPTPLRALAGVVVGFFLLLGAGTAILNFHADVNMPAAHREMYRLLTGETRVRPPVMEVPYALGVGLGILLFFHRPWRSGPGGEPSPLEVEMDVYDRKLHAFCRDRGGRS